MITVVGPREAPMNSSFPFFVNTTSRSSSELGREFSPFFLGPCQLYDGAPAVQSMNMENAWQFSKVFKNHLDDSGHPSEKWRQWAKSGFASKRAHRYPMGKGINPEYSYWDGECLGYIEARMRIYIPLYKEAVLKKDAFRDLCDLYEKHGKLILWDFDGYNRKKLGLSPEEVVKNPNNTMGHAFVIEQLLLDHFEGELNTLAAKLGAE